jgi:16S rRNA (guanine966-N2)-methyltransferase
MRVIAGKFRNRTLKTGPQFRPTTDRVRETLFDILQEQVPQAVFVDVFAASGSVGIEALSRGASRAIFVESNRRTLAILEQNLKFCEDDQWRLLACNWTRALPTIAESDSPDILFFDPPYDYDRYDDLLAQVASLFPHALYILELSARTSLKLPDTVRITKDRQIGETRLLFLQAQTIEST